MGTVPADITADILSLRSSRAEAISNLGPTSQPITAQVNGCWMVA